MDVQIIHKILHQKKLGSIFLVDIQCPTIWAFDNIENKHTLYRGEDYVKKICTSLREHTANVNNFEKKKMSPLTKRS